VLRSAADKTPKKFRNLIEAIQEIEDLAGPIPLDYEYAVKRDGSVVTFQVRPLSAVINQNFDNEQQIINEITRQKKKFEDLLHRKPHLAGENTILTDMSDWNPAEIIGMRTRPLSFSLYNFIITNGVWCKARASQGYYDVQPAQLVYLFGNKPYVDVRASFNSFIPDDIDNRLREKLVKFYINKLKNNPQLQDKVEFDILYTIYDFSFNSRSKELIENGFSRAEIGIFKKALLKITNDLIDIRKIEKDINTNEEMDKKRKVINAQIDHQDLKSVTKGVFSLLNICKEKGTFQFSRLARQGFVANILLKSLLSSDIIESEIYADFLNSIRTIASEISRDTILLQSGKLSMNDFLERYGHLRPGTYNITFDRYDRSQHWNENKDLLNNEFEIHKEFVLSRRKSEEITHVLHNNGFKVECSELFAFMEAAIVAREYSKFLFTKCLSDSIELIAEAGKLMGFSREDMSYLQLNDLSEVKRKSEASIRQSLSALIKKRRSENNLYQSISFPAVIMSAEDFSIITQYKARPNFITRKIVEKESICFDESINSKGGKGYIRDKIIVVENADPGFDWIFLHRPAGLITKYGGVASHMAIRCAEMGIPAIIGCGELYDQIRKMKKIRLDCLNKKVREVLGTPVFSSKSWEN